MDKKELSSHVKLIEASIRRCETFVNLVRERYGFPEGNVYDTLARLKDLEARKEIPHE